MMVCLPLFFDLERPNSVCREGGFTPPRHTEAMQNRVKITNFLQLEEYSLGIIIISYWVGSIINNMSLNYVYWAHMSHKWAQNILPELWLRLVRLGWHIIYNSATQPEVSSQPVIKTNKSYTWVYISISWSTDGQSWTTSWWVCRNGFQMR